MSREEGQDLLDRNWEIQRAMEFEVLELARKRTRWIMIMGSVFSFAMFPVGMFVGVLVDTAWGETASMVVPAFLPLGLGALIAFLGMTMTDHRRNVAEWGVIRPGTCLGYGMLPFLLTVVFPPALILMTVMGLVAWLLMILGGWITAEMIERSLSRKP